EFFCQLLVSPYPGGDDLPLRLVCGAELRASAMPLVAARLVSERVNQQAACLRIAGNHLLADRLEILPRLLLVPRRVPGRQRLEAHGGRSVALPGPQRVAGVAASVTHASREEDRLHSRFEGLIVQSRRRWGRGLRCRSACICFGGCLLRSRLRQRFTCDPDGHERADSQRQQALTHTALLFLH